MSRQKAPPRLESGFVSRDPAYFRYASLEPVYMGGPELVAAVIQQPGKIPEILQAFRIVPSGKQPDLQAVKLRGKVLIDPNDDSVDLFTKIIEERKRSSSLGTERAHPVIDTSEDAHSTPATQAAGQMLIVGYTTNVFSLLSEVT